jgi:hypothetical protein
MAPSYFLLVVLLALASSQAIASDPSPLQDFCVADKHSPGMYVCTYYIIQLMLWCSCLVIKIVLIY